MKSLLLTLCIAASFALGCKPDEPVVTPEPDVNERGEYFNCYIDGKYWTFKEPEDWLSNDDNLFAGRAQITRPGFKIEASNDAYPTTVFELWTVGDTFPSKDTVMLAAQSGQAYGSIIHLSRQFPDGSGSTDDSRTGRIFFSQRSMDKLEGTFYFDAFWPDSNRIIHITKGRFSIIPD